MKLKQKFIITLISGLIVYAAVNYSFFYFYVIPASDQMDISASEESIERCQLALTFICKEMDKLVQDYAVWDDCYSYASGSNKTFAQTNLGQTTFKNNDIDFILIFDDDRELIWGNSIEAIEGIDSHPTTPQLVNVLTTSYGNLLSTKETKGKLSRSGLVKVNDHILVVAFCSILPQNENKVPLGTFVMAKVLDKEELQKLSELVLHNFDINHLTDADISTNLKQSEKAGIYSIKANANDFLEIISVYPDIGGESKFKIKTFTSRELFSGTQKIAKISFIIILISGVALILLIGICVQVMIIRPVSRIKYYAKELGKSKDYSINVKLNQRDELGELNAEFSNVLHDVRTQRDGLEGIVKEQTEEIHKSRTEMIYRLASAAENRDNDTGMHLKRIYEYSKLLAKNCDLPEGYCEIIGLSGILHDVGKIGIPDSILLKPGKLTPEEYEIIKKHSAIGAKILENGSSKLMITAHEIALYHHERYDGNGYPEGLKGEKIPISARITSIVDVFDALTSKRPYKEPWNTKQVIIYFNEEKGKMFDPQMVNCFLLDLDSFIKIKNQHADK